MRRRDFFAFVGGATASAFYWPLAARARQSGKLPIIGFLVCDLSDRVGPAGSKFHSTSARARLDRRRNVSILYRWAEGKIDRYAALAAEFVQLKVDVIVTVGSAIPAVKRATSTIPIVFAAAVDPLGSGSVASLARPGGNITGLSLQSSDMAGKRIALLRQIVPDLANLAIMANAGYPAAVRESTEVAAAAQQLGLAADTLSVNSQCRRYCASN